MTRVKVLVVPIYKRYWLYHAWSEGQAEAAAIEGLDWRKAGSIQEKFDILKKQMQQKVVAWIVRVSLRAKHLGEITTHVVQLDPSQVNKSVQNQWRALETSEKGTFRSYLYG